MSNTQIPSVLWSADQTGVLSSDDIARAKANIGLATAVVLKGNATVAQLNDMTQDGEHEVEAGLATGWQFTMSDSGTLRAGLLVVSSGDKVVWNGSSWEMAGGAGGGVYVLNAGYNISTKVWTLPSQADFDNMDSSGSVLLKVARTDASGNSAGISWYDLTYKFEDTDVGMTQYTFTGTSTTEILQDRTIPMVQQITISVPLPTTQGASIICAVSDKGEVIQLSATYHTDTNTWTWPAKTDLNDMLSRGVGFLRVQINNGYLTTLSFWYTLTYTTPGYSGTRTCMFTGRSNLAAASANSGSVDESMLITEQIKLTIPPVGAITYEILSVKDTQILNATYNPNSDSWTWPSADEIRKITRQTPCILYVLHTTQSSIYCTYILNDFNHSYGSIVADFITMENVDSHPQKIQLYLPDSDNQPTATVTTYPIIRNYYVNPASSLYPTASEIKKAIRTHNDVVVLQGSRQQGTDYFYAASNNSGNIVFSRAKGIEQNGKYSSAQITLDTTDNTWSYSSYGAFIDGGYEILNWGAATDQPVHNDTHLISCSGSNQPTLIYISKCHAAKMYDVHCMLAYHTLKLYNDDNSNFSSYTVYDNRVIGGQADTPYVLTRGEGVALWTNTNTHGVTAHFLIVADKIYISYGY